MVRKTLTLFHYWNEPADKAPQNKNNKQDVYPTSSSVAFKLYFLFKTYLYAACAHLHSIPNELLQLQIDSIYSIRQYALNWDYTSSASSWRNHNITWVASDRHKNTHHLYHTSHLLTLRSLFQHAKSTHVECRAAGFSHYVVLQSQVYNCLQLFANITGKIEFCQNQCVDTSGLCQHVTAFAEEKYVFCS